jgi:hypothetical protein
MRYLGMLFLAAGSTAAGCGRPGTALRSTEPLLVVARDFAFDAPDTIAAGILRLTFHNEGPSYHHVQILRLLKAIPDSLLADSLPPSGILPDWLLPVGGAEGADSIAREVTVELKLSPGHYVLVCRITTPTDQVHYALGMLRSLVVVGSNVRVDAPLVADRAIHLANYSIRAPDTLRTGTVRFRVSNAGPLEHHVAIARLAAGRSLKDVVNEPPGADPVFQVLGGTAGLAPGQENVLELGLRPGHYVYLCFVPDPATHLDHYQMGMVQSLTVVP